MTIGLNIKGDVSEVRRLFRELGPGIDRAVVRAINKTATTVRAQAARDIQQKRNLKIGTIKQKLILARARRDRLSAAIIASGKPIPIREFGARQTRQGVTVKIEKGGKRQRLQRFGNKSFVIPRFGSNVFVRKTGSRLPIKEWARVPGIPTVFVQERIEYSMKRLARLTMAKRLPEEIRFELRKAEAKARG